MAELVEFVRSDSDQQRGEAVLLLQGAAPAAVDVLAEESRRVADLLVAELPVKQAAALTAKITGARKNLVYDYLLKKANRRT